MANSNANPSQLEQWRTVSKSQKEHTMTEQSMNLKCRRQLLSRLKSMLRDHEEAGLEALKADLGKRSAELMLRNWLFCITRLIK